jgi:hypothetical protein
MTEKVAHRVILEAETAISADFFLTFSPGRNNSLNTEEIMQNWQEVCSAFQ